MLASVLFNNLVGSTMMQPTNTLYPALQAGLRQPDGKSAEFMCNVLDTDSYWSWARVKSLASELMATAIKVHQANNMWGGWPVQSICSRGTGSRKALHYP